MNKLEKIVSGSGLAALFPMLAFAQVSDVNDVLGWFSSFLNAIIPILISLAFVYLLWGIVKFVTAGDDPVKRASGRAAILWGIVALFVMVSIWGLVNILSNTFSLSQTGPHIPTLPTPTYVTP